MHNYIISVGTALYGEKWVKRLSKDLDVSERSLRRFASGNWDIPENIPNELSQLVQDRIEALQETQMFNGLPHGDGEELE